MLSFNCDYMEGAHPDILERLLETNLERTPGYGEDAHTRSAKEKIRRECGCPDAEVFFLVGGTQTNAAVIRGLLRPHEGVIAAQTGHINVHEAGAVEAGGHKVLALPQREGKLAAAEVRGWLEAFFRDASSSHMVQPGMVYISHPTEFGTLYTKAELKEEREEYRRVRIRVVDEREDPTLADSLDYYYVPCFFVDGQKRMEGVPDREAVEAVLREAAG